MRTPRNPLDRLSPANRASILALLTWMGFATLLGWRLLVTHGPAIARDEAASAFPCLTFPIGFAGALIALLQFVYAGHDLRNLDDLNEHPEMTREKDLVRANRIWAIWLLAANLLPVLVLLTIMFA